MGLGNVLRLRRKELSLTLLDIAERMGVSEATVQRWESGNIKNLRHDRVIRLAQVLDISPAQLMGWTSVDDRTDSFADSFLSSISDTSVCLPVLGKVAAGTGCLAQNEILCYEVAGSKYNPEEYFYLQVQGDSMSPGINDGDLVMVRQQDDLNVGEIGVFLIDGEDGVVKKYEREDDGSVTLVSFNPYYPPRKFSSDDMRRIKIIGRVVESKRKW